MTAAVAGWLAAGLGAIVGAGLAWVRWRVGTARAEAVAHACHELRGPLAAARLGLQLGARIGELSPDRLRAIDLEIGRAALALDDLDLARSRARARARETVPIAAGAELVSVSELVRDSVAAWSAAAAARGVELSVRWDGPDGLVRGERLRLARAPGNLIANAIEHGDGPIEVHGRCTEAGIRVEVRDGGAGLPAPVAELARRRHRAATGRGRGLAIASAVAAAHGGRLAAAPSERGARLVLELPLAAAAALRAPGQWDGSGA